MKALVTGGGGFIGSALVNELVKRGYYVTSYSRGDYPELRKIGVVIKRGDISNREAVLDACEGIDIVFHVAAKAGTWGSYKDYYNINVKGTENIIDACREKKIKWLIYTSSASVVLDRSDIKGSDESLPYPSRPLSNYTATKAKAERNVLKANSSSLKTMALRPHIVLGPGDKHFVPGILEQAGKGKLKQIGDGRNIVDIAHISNVVAAHLCAAIAIQNDPEVAGKVFFVTDGEPVNLWDHINIILQNAGLDPVKKSVTEKAALVISFLTELTYHIFGIKKEPRLTRFLVQELSRSHWFDITAACKLLGYNPVKSF
jgi:nucleoside-diphosphate-sugar epimerase